MFRVRIAQDDFFFDFFFSISTTKVYTQVIVKGKKSIDWDILFVIIFIITCKVAFIFTSI